MNEHDRLIGLQTKFRHASERFISNPLDEDAWNTMMDIRPFLLAAHEAAERAGHKANTKTRPKTGGRTPYGFIMVQGDLVFDATTPIGNRLIALIKAKQAGGTYREIAAWANAQGWAGPGCAMWTHQAVHRVINRGRDLAYLLPLNSFL